MHLVYLCFEVGVCTVVPAPPDSDIPFICVSLLLAVLRRAAASRASKESAPLKLAYKALDGAEGELIILPLLNAHAAH